MGDETITPTKLEVGKSQRDYLTESIQKIYGRTIFWRSSPENLQFTDMVMYPIFAVGKNFSGPEIVYTQKQADQIKQSAKVPA